MGKNMMIKILNYSLKVLLRFQHFLPLEQTVELGFH